jgi:hypothetical protein
MGLLDSLGSDDGMLGLYLLAAGAAKPQRTSLGEGLLGGMQLMQQQRQGREDRAARDEERKQRGLFQSMQIQQMQQAQQERAAAQQAAQAAASRRGGFLDSINPQSGPAMPYNPAAALQAGLRPEEMKALAPGEQESPFGKVNPGDYTPESVAEFAATRDFTRLRKAEAQKAPESAPTSIREYQFAVDQGYKGTFEQWEIARKRAGATNIGMPKIDIKMGDSVAGQVGPMVKDSKIQAGGAIKMFDAADRIEKALDSKLVKTGPLASKVQTVKQFVQVVAGGNDAGIRQTQQVIRSLAQMSVEARKQLQGQGQVTETEAAAVAKADAGDIDSLTTGELRDLVALTKRAAHFTAKGHAELVRNMESNEGTRGAAPFYRVQGLDQLLRHAPALPQIGGAPSVDDLVKKYGGN